MLLKMYKEATDTLTSLNSMTIYFSIMPFWNEGTLSKKILNYTEFFSGSVKLMKERK